MDSLFLPSTSQQGSKTDPSIKMDTKHRRLHDDMQPMETKKHNQRRNFSRRTRLQENNHEGFDTLFVTRNYIKFFSISTRNENDSPATIDVIKANRKPIKALKGKQKSVEELRNGTLLMEVAYEGQSKALVKLSNL